MDGSVSSDSSSRNGWVLIHKTETAEERGEGQGGETMRRGWRSFSFHTLMKPLHVHFKKISGLC